ncbi:MAG: nucleotide exchange factor GrpE [Prochlorococcus sp. SP3034]|nr:nucleotide exchange factor GrpE [Prochlorococcus sp. SP3034]|tara:strand:- start:13354 stop:14091 length:738 start_codon:yes stop_codon:yes gene_type:complete
MIENQSENTENLEGSDLEVQDETPSIDKENVINLEKTPDSSQNIDFNNEGENVTDDLKNTVTNNDARLEQLEKEHETLKSQYVRIAADFDNFRKRQSRDQDDLKVQLISKSLTSILPIVDNFERARQQLKPENEEAQTLHRSYQGLYKQLVDVLKQQGVAPMRVVGQAFDPNLHEAVLREPNDEFKEDIIIEELQRGYHLDGKVLRHALVKVSMGPVPNAVSQDEPEKDTVDKDLNSDKNLSEDK